MIASSAAMRAVDMNGVSSRGMPSNFAGICPLPWQSLKYDTRVGAYRTGVTQDQLRARRNFATKAWNWGDPARNRALDGYCDVSGMPLA